MGVTNAQFRDRLETYCQYYLGLVSDKLLKVSVSGLDSVSAQKVFLWAVRRCYSLIFFKKI